ncbi:hypothetical protein ACSSS7_008319 [Eimeria intestinalis]
MEKMTSSSSSSGRGVRRAAASAATTATAAALLVLLAGCSLVAAGRMSALDLAEAVTQTAGDLSTAAREETWGSLTDDAVAYEVETRHAASLAAGDDPKAGGDPSKEPHLSLQQLLLLWQVYQKQLQQQQLQQQQLQQQHLAAAAAAAPAATAAAATAAAAPSSSSSCSSSGCN